MKTKKELKESKRMKNYWRRRLYVSKKCPGRSRTDWKHFREMMAIIGIIILMFFAVLYAIFGR